jgi:DedD protein
MEVRGEDFVKNLEIERQKTKLEEERLKLEEQKEQSVILNSNNLDNSFEDTQVEDNELDDIKLDDNKDSKQNYIILGFAFVLLFLITIIIIRLISGDDTKSNLDDNTFIQTETTEEIISTKQNEDIVNDTTSNDMINKALDIQKIETNKENEIIVEDTPKKESVKDKELQNNIFEINQQEQTAKAIKKEIVKPKVEEKKETKKKLVNPYKNIVIKDEYKPSVKVSSSKIHGYFIQIGAFSKVPNKKLLSRLHNANLNYKLHKMTINGKKYIKLLVGPYKSHTQALKYLSKTRQVSKNNKAYILRFK